MSQSTTRATRLAMLERLATTGGPLDAAQLQLIKAPFTPSPSLVPADLEEADFDGYAAETALAYNPAYVRSDGAYVMTPGSTQFTCTGATTPNVIYGWAVLNTGGTAVVYAETFDDPVPINVTDDGLEVDPALIWGV